MRIVDVSAFYSPKGGGVRNYIERKMNAAPGLGHELVVLVPGAEEGIERHANGSVMHTIAAPTMPLDRRYHYFDDEAALHRALNHWQPDHVEASSPWSSATMVGRWEGRATRSLVLHADPLASYAYRWLDKIADQKRIDRMFGWFWSHLRGLDRMFDVLVTPNEDYRRRLSEGGLKKVVSVPFGVGSNRFTPDRRNLALRAGWLDRLGLGTDALLLLGVGRLSPEKRWSMVLDAVAEASKTVEIGFVLVGAGKAMEALRRRMRKFPNIRIAGPIDDRDELADLLASADGLIHGCESETFCLAVAEGKASGLPIIVPDRGGAASQFDGRGAMYKSGSRHDLTRAIIEFARGHDAAQPASSNQPVRTLDRHFEELFALYARGLPLDRVDGDSETRLFA